MFLVTCPSWPFPSHHSSCLGGTLLCPILFPSHLMAHLPHQSWLQSLCPSSVWLLKRGNSTLGMHADSWSCLRDLLSLSLEWSYKIYFTITRIHSGSDRCSICYFGRDQNTPVNNLEGERFVQGHSVRVFETLWQGRCNGGSVLMSQKELCWLIISRTESRITRGEGPLHTPVENYLDCVN